MSASKRTNQSKASPASGRTAKSALIGDYAFGQQVGHLLRRAHQRHCGIFADGARAVELTPMQFAVLANIAEQVQVSQNQLGRLVAMDPATTQGVVKRLAERDLIVAEGDPLDRRRNVWRLTPSGKRVLKNFIPSAKKISIDTLAPLSAGERRDFLRLLKKMI